MRGKKAKRLRALDPTRPNPGRKNGGFDKDKVGKGLASFKIIKGNNESQPADS